MYQRRLMIASVLGCTLLSLRPRLPSLAVLVKRMMSYCRCWAPWWQVATSIILLCGVFWHSLCDFKSLSRTLSGPQTSAALLALTSEDELLDLKRVLISRLAPCFSGIIAVQCPPRRCANCLCNLSLTSMASCCDASLVSNLAVSCSMPCHSRCGSTAAFQ